MKEMRPRHIVLFIVCCFVLLGAVVVVGDWCRPMLGGVRCPHLELSAISGQQSAVSDQQSEEQTMVPLELADSASLAEEVKEKAEPQPVPQVVETVGTLDNFIAGLREAGEKQVRVVHYGDSQIEEDRITSTLRTYLQNAILCSNCRGTAVVLLVLLFAEAKTRSLAK